MPAKLGNKTWIQRFKDGRDKTYTPDEFLTLFEEYMEYKSSDKAQWYKHEAIKAGPNTGDNIKVKLGSPWSIGGFAIFCGIVRQTILDLRGKEGYSTILWFICNTIEDHQLEGAQIGVYNPKIVACILGLREGMDITSKGDKIGTASDYSTQELREMKQFRQKQLDERDDR